MKNVLTHKGYTGSVEFSLEDECLHGKILFVNDVVTYEAETLPQLLAEFVAAVDDYLETCAQLGKNPDKPYSGTFNVRIGPEMHQDVAKASFYAGIALNEFVRQALKEKLASTGKEVVHKHHHEVVHQHHYHQTLHLTQDTVDQLTAGGYTLGNVGTRQHRTRNH